ncbi:carnitine O-acetyltransferase-like [Amphibalanus amphitrite]|uniref:carnitine O-acetyltransferase-like n=1 Tax=Amphibalanus amphitrite TaxID=1232801 RepID=UPI001C9133DD|nr:carnitine O-acetyltransferase-like [Amphibalanus amphitrite]
MAGTLLMHRAGRTAAFIAQQSSWRLQNTSVISQLCQRSFLPFSYPSLSALLQHSAQYTTAPPKPPVQLPRLPLPALENTLNKYLRSLRPLVTADELVNVEKMVSEFLKPASTGQKLQAILEKKYNNTDNWLADWWLNTAYLEYRSPVVVWSSPGLVMPLQQWDTQQQQLKYAARLISDAMAFKKLLDEGRLPQEYAGPDPLDMQQYKDVLGTCRIPGVDHDTLQFHPTSEHVLVAHRGHFFTLKVYGRHRKLLSEAQIYEQLCQIAAASQIDAPGVGILTTENRNVWGKAYKKLCKDKENRHSLEAIHSALFVVCLDGPSAPLDVNRQTAAALQCVHGGGADYNSANRWFDKCIQFVVGCEGNVGITYEHSPAEGVPVARMMDYLVQHRTDDGGRLPALDVTPPERLQFNLDDELHRELTRAREDLEMMVQDLDMACFTYSGYGKKFIKSQRMSPDSYIQMAIQLAFYRIHGEPGATYESAATRKFQRGRTETIRSCSAESVAFCQAMLDPSAAPTSKIEALRNAINAHKEYAKDAVNGLGCDRHMLGLKLAAIENGMDVPEIFMDGAWSRSTHMKLSTSQVPVVADAFMCYGPLVPDGYGCCYNPRDTQINFGTSACNSSPATVAADFRGALENSLNDMFNLLHSG